MQQTHRISRLRRVAGILAFSCFAASGLWAQTVIRINCGGASSTFTGPDGQQWLTDRYFTPSDMRYTSSPVGNTADQYLYRTARAGLYSDFQYNIPVTNGSYNLTLKFAEIQYTSQGQRVFNVTVNGVRVLNNFDIMAEVPSLTALDKTFPVTVTNGNINIQFTGVVNRAIINGIKVESSTSQPVTVSVNPAQVSLGAGQTATFKATVGGTSNTAVTWAATAGTIDANGVYTAPSAISQASTAKVTATSVANSQVSAAATVNLVTPVKVAVSPATASVASGGKVQFTATVSGTSDARVTWTASAGTIDGTGLLTAPAVTSATTVTVKAVSVVDTTASATAQAAVAAPAGTPAPSGPYYSEVAGLVSLEAEHGTIINRSGKQWTVSTNSWNCSGGAFLLPSPTTGTVFDPTYVGTAPEVQFQVNFQTVGTYAVWLRGAGSNVNVGLDGAAVSSAYAISNFTTGWTWSHTRIGGAAATITVSSPGVHTVNVWMRDDAFWFDKIVLAQSTSYWLGGTDQGPAESALVSGTTTTPPPTTTTPPPPTTTTGTAAGRVSLMKVTNPNYDKYIISPTTTMQQFELQHIQRMVVYSPYFNGPSSWYPSGLIYADSYAIYPGGTFGEDVLSTHPEWIMKDANGNRLYIPWGCSGGTCPQYAADFSNPNYRQWWISKVKAELSQGNYKGVFIDDVNFDWRISDGWGNTVTPRDPNTNAPMTLDNWRLYFAQFLEAVRQGLSGYEICHNSIWFAGGDSGRDSNPYIQRQIAAADDIFIEFGINDGGLTGGTGQWSVDAVLSYVERLNALGKHMVLAGLAAGSSTDRVGLEFGVAGYLLVNNGSDYAADTYMVIDPGNWWPGFNVDLGSPSGSRYTWNGLMRRDFSGGMVLLNDPWGSTVTVSLPGTFKRVDGTSVTSVTLGARQAAILTK